jgi:transcription elongation factor Elf1
MSTTNDTIPGLSLPCPCCGCSEATITLCLADATTLTCQDCGGEFTTDDVRSLIRKWAKVLKWVDAMPSQADVDAE